MRTTTILRILILVLVPLVAGCAGRRHRTVVIVTPPAQAEGAEVDGPCDPPPPDRTEIRTVAPTHAHVWIPGHWQWRRGRYVWVAGHWTPPERPGAEWVPGHWKKRRGAYVWQRGHWK